MDLSASQVSAEPGTGNNSKKGAGEELARDRHGRRHHGRQSEEQSAPVLVISSSLGPLGPLEEEVCAGLRHFSHIFRLATTDTTDQLASMAFLRPSPPSCVVFGRAAFSQISFS